MWKFVLVPALAVAAVALATAYALSWSARNEAATKFAELEAAASLPEPATVFDVAMLDGLPEIARRYFLHAVAPGTPLRTTVRLRMEGLFLLGDASQYQTYSMSAVQVLSPPDQFVWIPTMNWGALQIVGSDGIVGRTAWTRFWLAGLIPVVDQRATADLARAALSRPALEAIWAPASLLPQNGAVWAEAGPNSARITFPTGIEPILLVLDTDGSVLEVTTMRWSDANADKSFRLQPFGGTVEAEATIGGYTIPTQVKVGNHIGTEAYLPFFQARITEAVYLPQ